MTNVAAAPRPVSTRRETGCYLCASHRLLAPPPVPRLAWQRHVLCAACGLVQSTSPARTIDDAGVAQMLTAPPTARQHQRALQIGAAFSRLGVLRALVDVGCGDGKIASLASAKLCVPISGVDPAPLFAQAARTRLPTVWADVTGYQGAPFDGAIVARTLSVVADPIGLLRDIRASFLGGGDPAPRPRSRGWLYVNEANLLRPNPRKRLDRWLGDEIDYAFAVPHLLCMLTRAGFVEHDVKVTDASIEILARVGDAGSARPPSTSVALSVATGLAAHDVRYWADKVRQRVGRRLSLQPR